MPRLLVHTNFGDGLRLKRQYLRNHTSVTTINTSIQRSIHCASSREKRGEKALQTSEIHGKTRRKASCRLSKTKRDRSRSVEQLRSSFFLESIGFFFLVTSSIECKAIWAAITTEIASLCAMPGRGRGSTAKASAFPWVGELQTNATARVHGGFSQIRHLRLGEEKTFPSVPFVWKSVLKWPHSVVSKPSTTIRRNLTGPALKG